MHIYGLSYIYRNGEGNFFVILSSWYHLFLVASSYLVCYSLFNYIYICVLFFSIRKDDRFNAAFSPTQGRRHRGGHVHENLTLTIIPFNLYLYYNLTMLCWSSSTLTRFVCENIHLIDIYYIHLLQLNLMISKTKVINRVNGGH